MTVTAHRQAGSCVQLAWLAALGRVVAAAVCASTAVAPAVAQAPLPIERLQIVATRLGPATTEAWLVFGPNGDVTGSTGCNSFHTRAEIAPAAPPLAGRLLFIGPMRATERACMDRALAQQERAIFDAIATTAGYAEDPGTGRVTLHNRGGEVVLELIPAP
ncbi:MAG: META domain-containing protein [Pseudomonadota bacterium]